MKMFLRVLMVVIIAINSIAGTSLALVACECADGVHIEFSQEHCCSHTHTDADSPTLNVHNHCHDFVLAGFSEKDFSDTSQLIKIKDISCFSLELAYQFNFVVKPNCDIFKNFKIKTGLPPPLIVSPTIPLLI